MGELGYNVKLASAFHDSARAVPTASRRRAASTRPRTTRTTAIVSYRLFYDTVKGGDFRSREANVYRLAQISVKHHRPVCGAGRALRARVRRHAGQPERSAARRFRARSTRAARRANSFCWARTARHCMRQIGSGQGAKCTTSREMMDVVRGRRPGARHRHVAIWSPARSNRYAGARGGAVRPVAKATVFYLSTNAMNCNVMAAYRAHRQGRRTFANPCFTQIHPDLHSGERFDHQSKLTLMSESRCATTVAYGCPNRSGRQAVNRRDIPEGRARLLPGTEISRASATWLPRDISSRSREGSSATRVKGVGATRLRPCIWISPTPLAA